MHSLFLGALFLLFFQTCRGNEIFCSASENEKWDSRTRKCTDCKNCGPGNFRNSTEKYDGRTGEHGAEECLPCRECPQGTYSSNGVECKLCVVACEDLNREYDKTCSRTSDAICGSCLIGFKDEYGSIKLPCMGKPENNQQIPPNAASSSKISVMNIAMVSAGIAVVGIVVVGGVVYLRPYLKYRARTKDRSPLPGHDNDIEMDCIPVDPTVSDPTVPDPAVSDPTVSYPTVSDTTHRHCYMQLPLNETCIVRGEFPSSSRPEARGELSNPADSERSSHFIYFPTKAGRGFPIECYLDSMTICGCFRASSCTCLPFLDSFEHIIITKSDKFIRTAADNICHDPMPLFGNLGLDNSVIYQENDTRNRAPEIVTLKELVIRLLNIWIERSHNPPKLQTLMRALCKANFHDICSKIQAQTGVTETTL